MASLLRQNPSRGAAGILCGRLAAAVRGSALPVAPNFPGAGAGVFGAGSPLWGALPGAAAGFHATAAAQKQLFTGIIVSDKMQKSVVVSVMRVFHHPKYHAIVRQRNKYMAHDEDEDFKIGDKVTIEQHRPISKRKAFIVKCFYDMRLEAVRQASKPPVVIHKEGWEMVEEGTLGPNFLESGLQSPRVRGGNPEATDFCRNKACTSEHACSFSHKHKRGAAAGKRVAVTASM